MTKTKLPGKPVTEMADSELAYGLTEVGLLHREYTRLLTVTDNRMRELEREQEARKLAAYWKANPTLTPIKVGDAVFNKQASAYPTEIAEVNMNDLTCVLRWWVFDKTANPHYWLDIPINVASEWRAAYLQSVADDREVTG